ncbi:hypothetical protein A3A67_01655 [Candidatus Peribacteria bacterium RIFCSPLOWO2_01_FULL_51_18]|nr:MAG: hypothetical protein A3C52_03905 [Candidatus Peribacteria bacterium RIFCSPHIGHO2_02_FULL_51_15]OGJ65173.1 MAG: hypothetical protein A3A67_01655 [Candidatus Peribacteria bacterium RIFCSPLOWO2_01_FULL_51_18]
MNDPVSASGQQYNDDDLVYVDTESRTVIGRVEWTKNEKPKSLPFKASPKEKKGEGKTPRRQFSRKYYPFGTYRSMKRIFKLQGKIKDPEPNKTLDEVIPRALKDAYWEWDEKKGPKAPMGPM